MIEEMLEQVEVLQRRRCRLELLNLWCSCCKNNDRSTDAQEKPSQRHTRRSIDVVIEVFVYSLLSSFLCGVHKSCLGPRLILQRYCSRSYNVPDIFGSMAELTAGHTGAQTVVADTDGVVLESIGEIVLTFSHCSNKNTDAFVSSQSLDVILYSHNLGIVTQGNLPTVVWQVIGNGIFDDFKEFLLGVCRPYGKSMQ